jgi:hypothetical protein
MKLIRFVTIALAICTVAALAACRSAEKEQPGVATPSVTLSRDRVPLGSPIDITYTFVVAPDAPPFKEDYRVFVGIVDPDNQLMWTDDHNPPKPTTSWKPSETVSYTRTIFVPVYPYVGEASVRMGLYSMSNQQRVPLNGQHVGQRSYEVAKLQLQPQTDNVFTVFKDGWHPAEVAAQNPLVEWQWTKKTATIAFKNPKTDSLFYLDVDNPGGVFNEPQHVRVSIGKEVVDEFQLTPRDQLLRKISLTKAQLGEGDMVEVQLDVDKTFVPSLVLASSKDPRELGIRVFHAFVQPKA